MTSGKILGVALVSLATFAITAKLAYAAPKCEWQNTTLDFHFVGTISCIAIATVTYVTTEDCECQATVSTSGSGGGQLNADAVLYPVGPTYIFVAQGCPSAFTTFTKCGNGAASTPTVKLCKVKGT